MIKYKHYVRMADAYPKNTVLPVSCTIGNPFQLAVVNMSGALPHGFVVGDIVRITGIPNGQDINGYRTVTNIINAFLFETDAIYNGTGCDEGTIQIYSPYTFTEVFPLGFNEVVWEPEDNEVFFRFKMPSELTFTNEPTNSDYGFDYFLGIEESGDRCKELSYLITRSCDNGQTYQGYWVGYLAVNDGRFDLDRCIFRTKIKVDDEYRCLIENGDKELNILKIQDNVSVPVDYSPTFEFITCGPSSAGTLPIDTSGGCEYIDFDPFVHTPPTINDNSCITLGVGWTIYLGVFEVVQGTGGLTNVTTTWIRETNTTLDIGSSPNPPIGSGWINIGATTIGSEPAHNWARTPYNGSYTNFNWSLDLGGCRVLAQYDLPLTNVVSYNTVARLMEDVVNYASSQNCSDFSEMVSDFFEINPPGDTPGYVPGINYVTGSTNRINLLAFIQKSDFLNPTTTTKAVKGILTFNQIMTIFKEVFQAYWFLENGQIRIEHISWFTESLTIDLTVGTYLKFIKGTNKYEYLKVKMPREENFKWTEAGNLDFLGAPIIYDSACVNQDEIKNTTIQNVVTDIQYISTHPQGSSYEGFVLIATEFNSPNYDALFEVGLLSGVSLPNNHLSLANLLYNYFRHERVLLEGTMNNIPASFFSAIKTKKQVPVSFPFCCGDEINPEITNVQTLLGTGFIKDAVKLNIKNNMMTVELLYD